MQLHIYFNFIEEPKVYLVLFMNVLCYIFTSCFILFPHNYNLYDQRLEFKFLLSFSNIIPKKK